MLELEPFTKGETCFYLLGNRVHKGKIKAIYQLDNINTKYLVMTGGGSVWMHDHLLYHSLNELFEDLKSCIIE